MSYSRLEKFIYAICSMDVSDLPVPLSRIEKLWNCLITGEIPDFEPLSRNEKYLMAMLDRYDISNLPAPMSRGEKLLYKIAVGETDLSDVPGYLSRYEELLKYLIENGGISGGDFEYVLYTLNQSLSTLYTTAEKPVKSAILKGKTVNNLWANLAHDVSVQEQTDDTIIEDYSEQYTRVTFGESQVNSATVVGIRTTQKLQVNKTYYINTFVFDALDVTDSFLIRDNSNNINLNTLKIEGYPPGQILSFTTQVETNYLIFYYFAHTRKYGAVNYGKPFYMPKRFIISDKLEDVVNQEFFEGMQSVKMPVLTTTGNNLLNPNILERGYLADGVPSSSGYQEYFRSSQMINVSALVGKKIYFVVKYDGVAIRGTRIVFYDSNKNYLSVSIDEGKVPNNAKFVKVFAKTTENPVNFEKVECCLSTINTYEPYKTNILTCNEDVELRGIDDVKDELNCLTGEVTQNIYQITLTGDESGYGYSTAPSVDTDFHGTLNIGSANLPLNKKLVAPISNRFQGALYGANKTWQCCIGGSYALHFFIPKTELETSDINGFKNWVKQQYLNGNPIKVAYILEEKSIKTVDLTTIDQDGQSTKLKTFNDITYVEINSDNIIPPVEVEVATKINETLSTMGLEHHDISETQNELSQTIDEQSENTDATMMATTEIYEQTL